MKTQVQDLIIPIIVVLGVVLLAALLTTPAEECKCQCDCRTVEEMLTDDEEMAKDRPLEDE